jgi:hypothetical protein
MCLFLGLVLHCEDEASRFQDFLVEAVQKRSLTRTDLRRSGSYCREINYYAAFHPTCFIYSTNY